MISKDSVNRDAIKSLTKELSEKKVHYTFSDENVTDFLKEVELNF